MKTIREAKQAARAFLQSAYSDEKLTQGLDHLRSGNFSFTSCCCFIGMATATHDLRGREAMWYSKHYWAAHTLPDAPMAELAALRLSKHPRGFTADDALLTRRLIPMFLAEIRRREKARHGRMETAAIVESTPSPVL